MKIRITENNVNVSGSVVAAGSELDMPDGTANWLINLGKAEAVIEPKVARIDSKPVIDNATTKSEKP